MPLATYRFLILEDDETYVQNYRSEALLLNAKHTINIELEFFNKVDEAQLALANRRFDGAVLDLRLSGNDDQAEGNKVAISIHEAMLIPMVVVSGFVDELATELQDLNNTGESALFRVVNKAGKTGDVFGFLIRVKDSGVLEIFGPNGELNRRLALIFWNQLGPTLKRWEGISMPSDAKPRFLRHAVAHLLSSLQVCADEQWDTYNPEEVYISPPLRDLATTGDIFELLSEEGKGTGEYLFLVTPACDVAKAKPADPGMHLVRILPASNFKKDLLVNIIAKKHTRYHALPRADVFPGGILDFWRLITVAVEDRDKGLKLVCSVVEAFTKDITARFGACFSRQGSPDLDSAAFLEGLIGKSPKN